MKYLVLMLTLIFSISTVVYANDHNTRWVLLFSFTIGLEDSETIQSIGQTFMNNKNKTFQD